MLFNFVHAVKIKSIMLLLIEINMITIFLKKSSSLINQAFTAWIMSQVLSSHMPQTRNLFDNEPLIENQRDLRNLALVAVILGPRTNVGVSPGSNS
jgi:hypothetical protein